MKKIKGIDVSLINLIIGVLATLMIFMPVLVLKDYETTYTGLEIVFGRDLISLGSLGSGQIEFNPLIILAFLLPFIAAIIPLFYKRGFIVSTVLYIVAIIFMFMLPQSTSVTMTILGNTTEIDVVWSYGIGLIFAAILSMLGAMLNGYNLLKEE